MLRLRVCEHDGVLWSDVYNVMSEEYTCSFCDLEVGRREWRSDSCDPSFFVAIVDRWPDEHARLEVSLDPDGVDDLICVLRRLRNGEMPELDGGRPDGQKVE